MRPTSDANTRTRRWCLAPVLLACLAACADDAAQRAAARDAAAGAGVSELPAPEGAVGSVTGMPANPGPGAVPIDPVASTQDASGGGDAAAAAGGPVDAAGAGQVAGAAQPGTAQPAGDATGALPRPAPPVSVDGVEIYGGVPAQPDARAPEAAPTTVAPSPAAEPPVTASTTFVAEPAATGEAHPEGHDDD